MNQTEREPRANSGLFFGLFAYSFWGFITLYWTYLQDVPAGQIICHRIIWSAAILGLLIVVQSRGHRVKEALKTPATVRRLALTGSLICANWLIFIWAVIHGFVIECALGYFLTPLVVALLGVRFLHEPLSKMRKVALFFASASVILLAFEYGRIPWVSVSLALTFSFYTLLRKTAAVGSFEGLFIETSLGTLFAFGYLAYCFQAGTEVFLGASLSTKLFLIGAGPVTAIPLVLFVTAARLIPLSTLAVLQYMAPTITFLIGVFVLHEPFTSGKFIAFIGVWIAVGIYIVEALWWPKGYEPV